MRDTIWSIYFGRSALHHLAQARYQVDPVFRSWYDLMVRMCWVGKGPFAGAYAERQDMIDAAARWDEEVKATVPADRLIVWKPADGWEPICAALDSPVPVRAAAERQRHRRLQGRHHRRRAGLRRRVVQGARRRRRARVQRPRTPVTSKGHSRAQLPEAHGFTGTRAPRFAPPRRAGRGPARRATASGADASAPHPALGRRGRAVAGRQRSRTRSPNLIGSEPPARLLFLGDLSNGGTRGRVRQPLRALVRTLQGDHQPDDRQPRLGQARRGLRRLLGPGRPAAGRRALVLVRPRRLAHRQPQQHGGHGYELGAGRTGCDRTSPAAPAPARSPSPTTRATAPGRSSTRSSSSRSGRRCATTPRCSSPATRTTTSACCRVRGLTQFVVGTGGGPLGNTDDWDPRLAAKNDSVRGALRIELGVGGARLRFVDVNGVTLDESDVRCRPSTPTPANVRAVRPLSRKRYPVMKQLQGRVDNAERIRLTLLRRVGSRCYAFDGERFLARSCQTKLSFPLEDEVTPPDFPGAAARAGAGASRTVRACRTVATGSTCACARSTTASPCVRRASASAVASPSPTGRARRPPLFPASIAATRSNREHAADDTGLRRRSSAARRRARRGRAQRRRASRRSRCTSAPSSSHARRAPGTTRGRGARRAGRPGSTSSAQRCSYARSRAGSSSPTSPRTTSASAACGARELRDPGEPRPGSMRDAVQRLAAHGTSRDELAATLGASRAATGADRPPDRGAPAHDAEQAGAHLRRAARPRRAPDARTGRDAPSCSPPCRSCGARTSCAPSR